MASWESAQIYLLFTDPSEGRSYPDLGSIPGPIFRHNYQPVTSWESAHTYPLFTSFSLAQLSASQNLQVASWESAHTYPLFIHPSEGKSYPDLGSIPGPFSLAQLSASQNLRVASWGSAHIYPLFNDPSEGRSYPDLGSIPGPFLWHNYQPVRIWGSTHIYPLFTDPSEGRSYSDLGSIPGPFLWHSYQLGRGYVWHHGGWCRSIRYSVICSYLYHYQQKHLQSLWLRRED